MNTDKMRCLFYPCSSVLSVVKVRQRYQRVGAQVLDTGYYGAVIVRSRAGGLVVETFRGKERFAVRGSNGDN